MKKINLLTKRINAVLSFIFTITLSTAFGQVETHLIKLTADCHGDYQLVDWATAYEFNLDYFTLERSEDGVNWSFVENVPAENNSGTDTYYYTTDYNISVSGLNYYRLIANGTIGDTLTLSSDESKCTVEIYDDPIVVSPNPSTGKVTVVSPPIGTFEPFSITDRTGHIVKKGLRNSKDFEINMEDLDEGLYFLFIGDNANPTKIWKK